MTRQIREDQPQDIDHEPLFLEWYRGCTIVCMFQEYVDSQFQVWLGKLKPKTNGHIPKTDRMEDDPLHKTSTWAKARSWAETYTQSQRKKNRDLVKLEVQNHEGGDAIIRGIHAGNSNITGTGIKGDRFGDKFVYPRSPVIVVLFAQQQKYSELGEEISKDIERVSIKIDRGWGAIVDDEQYNEMIREVEAEYHEAVEALDELAVTYGVSLDDEA